MTCGPRVRISPSAAIFTSTPAIGLPTVPMRKCVRRVDGDHRRRLGEAVALEDHQAGGVEELVDLRRERRAAGDEVAQPPAGARLELREHELLRDRVLQREQPARLAAGELHVGPPVGDAARPEEDLLLRRAPPDERVLEHARVHLLVQPRHRQHERRPHLLHVDRHRVDRLGVRDRRARVRTSGSGRPSARRCATAAGS